MGSLSMECNYCIRSNNGSVCTINLLTQELIHCCLLHELEASPGLYVLDIWFLTINIGSIVQFFNECYIGIGMSKNLKRSCRTSKFARSIKRHKDDQPHKNYTEPVRSIRCKLICITSCDRPGRCSRWNDIRFLIWLPIRLIQNDTTTQRNAGENRSKKGSLNFNADTPKGL